MTATTSRGGRGSGGGTRSGSHTVMGARADGSKLAAVIADQLVGDIAQAGWPVGSIVGSEAELLERYGVSRAVFREAVRLLEHLQVARMRRGPGGGLLVLAPTVDSVIDAAAVYLFYVKAEIDEVFEARLALESTATELASARLEEGDIAELRALIAREAAGQAADHRELHNAIANVARNPALAFFVDLLNRVTLLYLPRGGKMAKSTLEASAHAHAAIIDAVLEGDAALARNRMRKHLEAEASYLRARRPSRRRLADLPEASGRSDKRAELTARRIFEDVVADGWDVGALLGSEADLMDRYDVSRAVLRESVRMLEHHQVARMRRGPGGGLFVAEPGVAAVTDAVALRIDRLSIEPAHLFEVRGSVEMAVLDRVLATFDEAGADRLRAALEAERSASLDEFPVVGHDLHVVLAEVSGNRVLELLGNVLVRLSRIHSAAPSDAPATLPTQAVIDVHQLIVEAVLARDADLARHRMRRHLAALVRWVR